MIFIPIIYKVIYPTRKASLRLQGFTRFLSTPFTHGSELTCAVSPTRDSALPPLFFERLRKYTCCIVSMYLLTTPTLLTQLLLV